MPYKLISADLHLNSRLLHSLDTLVYNCSNNWNVFLLVNLIGFFVMILRF